MLDVLQISFESAVMRFYLGIHKIFIIFIYLLFYFWRVSLDLISVNAIYLTCSFV